MANRSDFFSSKLPRSLKKLISLGQMAGVHNKASASEARKLFIEAHASHVAFRMKRNTVENRDSGE